MKIAKKTLSVFLSFLMMFSACSVCLTGLTFSASAASSYTTTQVKNLVNAAASAASGTSSSSNAWNYTGDDGSVLAAAEAVYDYAVNSLRSSGAKGMPNASSTLASQLCSSLGYSTSSNQGKLITNILNPSGTTLYGLTAVSGSGASVKYTGSSSITGGTFSSDSDIGNAGSDVTSNSNVSYNSVSAVTKTTTVTVDRDKYLLTFSSISDIPSSFNTKVTYKFVNSTSKYAVLTKESTSGALWWKTYNYTYNSFIWHYLSSVNRTVNSTNTTSKSALQSFADYFTAERLNTTAADLLSKSADELQTLYDEASSKYTSLLNNSEFSSEVAYHFFDIAAIEDYLSEVEFAMQVVLAQPQMKILLECVNTTYDVNDRDGMGELYTKANDAYQTVKGYSEDIFNFVKANYEGYDDFSLEASKAYIDELYYNIELYDLRVLKNSIDTSIADNAYRFAEDADPLDHELSSNEELAALKDMFSGYIGSLESFSAKAQAAVFTDGTKYVYDFRDTVQEVIDVRGEEANYEPYYETLLPLIFANIERYTNEEIQQRYDTDIVTYNNLVKTYNSAKANIGQELTDRIYTFNYDGDDYLLTTATKEYIDRLKQNIISRNNAQLDTIQSYADMATDINFSNFIGIKTAIDNFDQVLYDYTNSKGWVDSAHKAIYNSINSLLTAYNTFIAGDGLGTFKPQHYHDTATGVYTTRYAGDQTDADGNQIGYVHDVARDNEDNNSDGKADDDYVVDEAKVNETIVKLDKFLTSDDFCDLVGFKNKETGEAYSSLSEAIDAILTDNIFTDKMINTVIALLFPTITSLLEEQVPALLDSLGGTKKDSNASGAVKLETLGLSVEVLGVTIGVGGDLDIYLNTDKYNGTQKQNDYATVFSALGLDIYPGTLADSLKNSGAITASSQIYKDLKAAGNSWKPLAVDPNAKELEYEFNYEWGVTDYNSFVKVLGYLFDSLGDLRNALFTTKTYTGNTNDNGEVSLGYAVGNITASAHIITDINLDVDVNAKAGAKLTIQSLDLYRKLWVPLMETLGVTDGGYTFRTLNANSSGYDVAVALFEPVKALIDQLKVKPLEKILEILPGVLYALSMDKLQDIIDDISIDFSATLIINELDYEEVSGLGSKILNAIVNLFTPLSIDVGSYSLALKDYVNLKDMLGFEYTNINTLLKKLTEMLGLDISLPLFNAGEVIQCSTFTKTASSARTSGKRLKFTADKADVFYFLLTYLVNAVGNKQFVEQLIALIGSSESLDLPDAVYTIIGNVNSNPKAALAALVELFCPQEYDKKDFDWYESSFTYDGIAGTGVKDASGEDLGDQSIVYLKYNNDWTRDKAEYVVDNVDELLESVLKMLGSDETSINVMLQNIITSLFCNTNITSLVKVLVTLGAAINNDFIYDLIYKQTGVELRVWYNTFGDLFPEIGEKYNNPAKSEKTITSVTATSVTTTDETTGEETVSYTWSVNGVEFEDGNRETFVDLFCALCGEFAPIISMLLSGEDMTLFEEAITITGYENYASSIGMIFEMLGIDGVVSQAQYSSMEPVAAFNMLTNQLFDWVDYMLEGNTIKKTVELLPKFTYFIQSNGLSTVLHNMLMPLLVLLDTVRPIVDVDINTILSVLVSDLLNNGTVDLNKVLDILSGTFEGETNPEYVYYDIDLGRITLDEIVRIVDKYFGTNLYESQLVTHGLNGLCAGKVAYDSVIGTAYKSTVDTADSFTITITSILEALEYETESGRTNGEIICEFIDNILVNNGKEAVAADAYGEIVNILSGLGLEYEQPDWFYMCPTEPEIGETIKLPEHSIVYLSYNNDWTKETAQVLDDSIEGLADALIAAISDEDLQTLINGVMNDNVYTDQNLNTVVEMLVNLLANFDETLRGLVDAVIATDMSAWFDMCTLQTNEDGTTSYVCTKDWGIDAAAAADKKDMFLSAVSEVLTPANELLSWFFFGTDYRFFTGTEKDEVTGQYTYNDVIVITGGEGYKWGIIPLLEAFGCENVQPAEYYADENGVYDVAGAVSDVFNALLNKIDSIAGKPAAEALSLLPNLIYFINADGLKTSVNNLLAPVSSLVEALMPVITGEKTTLGGLLEGTLGFDIGDLTMETILTLLVDNTGLVINEDLYQIIINFYIGELSQFKSANGEYAYSMTYNDEESRKDMITIVLSVALDIVNDNGALLSELLGEDSYNAIVAILSGHEGSFSYGDNNWAYMYNNDLGELRAHPVEGMDNTYALPEMNEIYTKYANDWSEATADTLNKNLADLIDFVLEAAGQSDTTLGTIINNAIADNLYSDAVLDAVLEAVVGLLAKLDRSLVDSVGVLLGADLNTWFDWCEITTDENGNTVVTCTKDWGIDSASDKEAAFVNALGEALEPADRVIAWLFFGQNYTFLSGTTKKDLITISGGEGYAYGIVPILEALGCEAKPAGDYDADGDGKYDVSAAVADVINSLLYKVDEICSGKSGETVDAIINILPNIIYFVNADGIKTSVNNLLAPVYFLLDTLEPVIGEVDFMELIGFDLNDLTWDTIFALLESSLGITLTDGCKECINTFYIGTVEEKTSANGRQYFYMNAGDSRRDMITIILSIALETLENEANKDAFASLLGETTYTTIIDLLSGAESLDYEDINWAYMYGGDIEKLVNDNLPARTGENSIVYTKYTNNWTEASADWLNDNLKTIVDSVVKALKDDGTTVGAMLDAAITGGLYKDEILDKLLCTVVKLLAGLDSALVESVGAVLGADLNTWFDWCDITYDENGKVAAVTCTKDWGIDAKATNEEKRDAFVAAFTEALAPANRVLAWLFFGEEYTFLNAADGTDLITIEGGEGYAKGVVPILEALGCKDVRTAFSFYNDGEYDVSGAVSYVLASVCDRLTDMCGDDTLGVMLDMLPNIVYFINADGVKASVNNILAPVYYLLEALSPLVGEINLDSLIGFPLSNITFDAIFDIVNDKVGLYFVPECEEFVKTFYMGRVDGFTSANGDDAFYMTYSDTETRRDMITILLSLVIDTAKYEDNEAILTKWLGADAYAAIAGILGLSEAKDMQDFSWYNTDAANTGKTFTAIESSKVYSGTYNEYWTKEKAQYVADNLPIFVGNILCLLGLEINGVKLDNINTVVKELLSSTIYTQANADAVLNMLKDLVGQLLGMEPYGEYVASVLNTTIGFDMHAWDNMTVTVTDGDRVSFEKAICEIIAPAAPIFKLLLAGEDVTLFFNIDGGNAITIPGSEGYAYGIIPLLEALGCDSVLTPDEFKAVLDGDAESAVKAVTTPLFDRIDEIADDPLNEILDMLPAVIYFINSNGLDTCVKNILNSVDTVLAALEPVLGASDVCSLIGIDLSTYDFEWIVDYLLTSIEESTGFALTEIVVDAISEFTVGTVVTYESKNGETYYTMKYASELDKADMVTVVLRMLIDFITMDENIAKIEELLKDYIPDEDNYNSVCSLLESLSQSAKEDPSMGNSLYLLYYIFVGLNESAEAVDDLYHDVNNSWKFILKMLDDSSEPVLNNFSKTLKGVLNKYFDDIFDEDGVAPNGFIRFFQKLAEFFRKIGDFFRNLFKKG